jgi:hypothetical protein
MLFASCFAPRPPPPGPIVKVVKAVVNEAMMDRFLEVMREDQIGSLQHEDGGCLQFQLLRDPKAPNEFRIIEKSERRARRGRGAKVDGRSTSLRSAGLSARPSASDTVLASSCALELAPACPPARESAAQRYHGTRGHAPRRIAKHAATSSLSHAR